LSETELSGRREVLPDGPHAPDRRGALSRGCRSRAGILGAGACRTGAGWSEAAAPEERGAILDSAGAQRAIQADRSGTGGE
jgi:hypothetical protein